jgi:S-adenosylmethionine synthetase
MADSAEGYDKVDRSAGYMDGMSQKPCCLKVGRMPSALAYCIGLVDPVSVMINTYGTGRRSDPELASLVRKVFPLSPKGMIDHLRLKRPIFRKTATYGHFGRDDIDFTWECVDAIDELRAKVA